MDKGAFQQEVYNVVAAIPSGKVVTYGQVAFLIGRPQCSRMVGHVMHDVPSELHLPCHRVVNSQGRDVYKRQVLVHVRLRWKSKKQ